MAQLTTKDVCRYLYMLDDAKGNQLPANWQNKSTHPSADVFCDIPSAIAVLDHSLCQIMRKKTPAQIRKLSPELKAWWKSKKGAMDFIRRARAESKKLVEEEIAVFEKLSSAERSLLGIEDKYDDAKARLHKICEKEKLDN